MFSNFPLSTPRRAADNAYAADDDGDGNEFVEMLNFINCEFII